MPFFARGIAQAGELVENLNRLAHISIPGVVKWRYTFDTDWSGDQAIFFWVVLTDEASNRANLRQVTTAFTAFINREVDPLNNWGLIPYFTFRSVLEQAKLKDEVFD